MTSSYIPKPDDAQKALQVLREIKKSLKPFDIINEEITIRVPEQTGEYNISLEISHKTIAKFLPLSFPKAGTIQINVHSLPEFSRIDNFFIANGDVWKTDVEKLNDSTKNLLLNFQFEISDDNYLKNLVQTDRAREVMGHDKNEYWLHAQIKHLAGLKKLYNRIDLRDVPFNLNVGVHQDIKNIIPKDFIDNLRLVEKLSASRDSNERLRLALAISKKRTKYTGKEQSIFSNFHSLFMPVEFSKFVQVTEPFYYSTCRRGLEFFDLPYLNFPKTMEVIARTNLSLENPAAEGKLIYSKLSLCDEIKKIFGNLK